jgi:hypothetical protein
MQVPRSPGLEFVRQSILHDSFVVRAVWTQAFIWRPHPAWHGWFAACAVTVRTALKATRLLTSFHDFIASGLLRVITDPARWESKARSASVLRDFAARKGT